MSETWPLVRIRWLDSSSPRMGWTKVAEWEGVGSLECVSVGYVIAEDAHQKTVAPHLAYPDDPAACQANGIIVIPTGAIVATELLAVTPCPACGAADRSSDRPESDHSSA